MQRGPSQVCVVCVPVRACGCECAALTCRLLTEVFVCTQASELRGPPALPPLPSEPRPCLRHFSDLAVFHCLLPTDPAGPPARTLSQPPFPSLPTLQHPGIAHGPLGTLPSQVDIWLGRLGAPHVGRVPGGGSQEGYQDMPPTPVSPCRGAPSERMCYRCYRPCLSICLSVCVSVTVREGCP